MHCLILEDESSLREGFRDFIRGFERREQSSFNIETVGSAAEAKALLLDASRKTQPYDVMLLDLSVPENTHGLPDVQSGLEVLKLAKEEGGAKEIVVISGHVDGIERARHLGATNWINKARFKMSDLENVLARTLGVRSFEQLEQFKWPGLFDALGRRIPENTPEHQQIQLDVSSFSDEFLRKLQKNPKLIYELSSRGFEELVADLLARLEYKVTLTPTSKDGGKDIYAAKKDHLGTFLFIVECKKYAPDRPVGVGLIRQLNGVVQAEQATAGILATTSFFTQGAQDFQQTIAFQISLKDYHGIQDWLHAVLKM